MREIKFRVWRKESKNMLLQQPCKEMNIPLLTDGNMYVSFDIVIADSKLYDVMEYVEILDAYEGDILKGQETDEYDSILSSWIGIVKYNESKGRIMIQDDLEDWFEVDDFEFDKVIGNIYQNPELIKQEHAQSDQE